MAEAEPCMDAGFGVSGTDNWQIAGNAIAQSAHFSVKK